MVFSSHSKNKIKDDIDPFLPKANITPLIDNINDQIVALDNKGSIIYFNQSAGKTFNLDIYCLGKNFWSLTQKLIGEKVYKNSRKALKNSQNIQFEHYLSIIKRNFLINIYPSHQGLILYFIDIEQSKTNIQEIKKDNHFLKSIIDQMPSGVVVAEAPSGKLIISNRELKNIFGNFPKSTSRIKQYEKWEAYHLDTGKRYESYEWPLARSLLNGETVNWEELKIVKKDGSVGYLRIRSSPIKDKQGNIIAGVAIDNDITKAKLTEDELFKSRVEFEAISKNSPDIILRFDKKFSCLYANPAFKKTTGLSPKKVVGKNIFEIGFPQTVSLYWEEKLKSIFTDGKLDTVEFCLNSRDYQAWLVPEFNRVNQVQSVLSVSRDITGIKEAERKKDEFISMASHELKTPVTTIKVFSHILRKSAAESNYEKFPIYLRKMEDQVNKLNKLVDQLLDVSRIQIGTLELNKRRFSLPKLIKEIKETIQTNNPNHQILTKNIENIILYGDKDRIGEVLINLLSNAIKYSPFSDNVLITTFKTKTHIIVKVIDYGIGIEKQYQDKIFQKLYRIYDSNDKTFPGFGMGLYISSEIIKLHSGQMAVKSKKGRGSTFSFTLPLIKPKTNLDK